ncbi:MAG: 23S rRNA pseudouridine(2605) synthase RluB [Pseudomonadota bacterium]
MSEKLQKVLARAGFASRRALEEWITAGRITVNGKIATLGDRVGLRDKIAVDGKPVSLDKLQTPPCRVLLYHKPAGEVCTRSDPEGRPTIFANLPRLKSGQWISVGRLDINTSGLLLLTTDGELANRLMHPSSQIEREYAVRVFGRVDEEMFKRMQEGVLLEDGLASFDEILDAGGDGSNHWYHVILREGRKREVRRLWESQGVSVSRLIRVRFGAFTLERSLRPGKCVDLPPQQVSALRQQLGLPPLETDEESRPKRRAPSRRTKAAPKARARRPQRR